MAYLEPEVYSEPSYIQNPGILRTLLCSEHWHIQNRDKFRSLGYSEPGGYSEVRQSSIMERFAKIINPNLVGGVIFPPTPVAFPLITQKG